MRLAWNSGGSIRPASGAWESTSWRHGELAQDVEETCTPAVCTLDGCTFASSRPARKGINTWTPIKLFSKPPHNCWKRASRVRNTSHFKLPLSSFVQKLWCQSCLLQNFASQQSMLIITVLHTCNLSQSKLMCAIKGVCGALIYRGVQIPR